MAEGNEQQRFNIEIWPRTTITGGGTTWSGTFYAIMDGQPLNEQSRVVCIVASEEAAEVICEGLNRAVGKGEEE